MSDFDNAIRAFIDRMLLVTVNLVADVERFPAVSARASGVLIPQKEDFLLLTAGHVFDRGKVWSLETNERRECSTLHLPLRDIQRIAAPQLSGIAVPIDIAWAWVRNEDIQDVLEKGRFAAPSIAFPVYQGPLDTFVDDNELFGFAASNRASFDPRDRALLREPAYEIGMTLKGYSDELRIVEFDLARKHQGDDYYEGASGAPIADTQGRIVALLTGGDANKNVLRGIAVSNIAPLFALSFVPK